MADEIRDANVIRVIRVQPGVWEASIGLPDHWSGTASLGDSPCDAIEALNLKLRDREWPFDESWTPRTGLPIDRLNRDLSN